ncbi:MAG TPA: ABC transporter ATP-binding protein [Clostridia bacterium]|nr:ABC transporter ATP-binding protein [Clostridia bacterium]
MLIAENLGKTYETKDWSGFLRRKCTQVEAVKDVSLEMQKGQIIGLLGINGAGKTTTIKMLSTLLQPTKGRIDVDGLDGVKDAMKVKKRINMITGGERMIYWRLTARENLWYYGQLYGIENRLLEARIQKLLSMVGLSDKQDIPVERFSKGMKQRLQIARGLINNPGYIFMDEPTLGLDAAIARELREYVKDLARNDGKAILLTTHYIQEVEELCEYVYVMDKGAVIVQGTPKELALMGIENKVLCLELNENHELLHASLTDACMSIEKDCLILWDDKNKTYTITSRQDMSGIVTRVLLEQQAPFRNFYHQEPSLEDAIIKLSRRGA